MLFSRACGFGMVNSPGLQLALDHLQIKPGRFFHIRTFQQKTGVKGDHDLDGIGPFPAMSIAVEPTAQPGHRFVALQY